MSISEEGKVRLMVIPIVAMLAVTMVVAGWQQGEEQVEIEVQKGENETEISYLQEEESSVDYNRSIMANTSIDGETVLEFEVQIESLANAANYHWTYLSLDLESDLPEELDPGKFRFRASEVAGDNLSDSQMDFLSSRSEIDNGSVLDDRELPPFEEHYSLTSNQFKASSSVMWRIREGNWGEPFTLNLDAVIEGLSEQVSATIQVHIKG